MKGSGRRRLSAPRTLALVALLLTGLFAAGLVASFDTAGTTNDPRAVGQTDACSAPTTREAPPCS